MFYYSFDCTNTPCDYHQPETMAEAQCQGMKRQFSITRHSSLPSYFTSYKRLIGTRSFMCVFSWPSFLLLQWGNEQLVLTCGTGGLSALQSQHKSFTKPVSIHNQAPSGWSCQLEKQFKTYTINTWPPLRKVIQSKVLATKLALVNALFQQRTLQRPQGLFC